jgi:hypothetical protein
MRNVRFVRNGLINVDGNLCYKGKNTEKLSALDLSFGIIRGHACFYNMVIEKWSELPKIAYANLLTFRYCQKLGLLRLLLIPDFDWNCPDGIVRLIPVDSTDKDHKTIDRNVCHTELKAAFAIIKKHHVLYQSTGKRRSVYLAAQKELIESGYVDFAKH